MVAPALLSETQVAAWTLAMTSADRQGAIFQSLLWFLSVVVVACLGVLVVWRIRSRMMRAMRQENSALSLEQLRRLRREGKLSDAEFQKLRDLTIHRS